MSLFRKLENWRVLTAVRKHPIKFSSWKSFRNLACIRYLTAVEKARLRIMMSVLLTQKKLIGVQGVELTDEMKMLIAAQACVPVLKLGLNYYSAFLQVSVYPTAFWVEHTERDENGLIHKSKKLLSGEAWLRGPVILSWSDIERDLQHDDAGHNVIIHEFVHKIDMLNQGANGVPPLPLNIHADEWEKVFHQAYHLQLQRLHHHKRSCMNTYAATSPAEYFAVASEYFFTMPQHLKQCSEPVYNELKCFYQQDPVIRLEG